MTRRAKLLALWGAISALWVGYAFAQPRSYYGYNHEDLLVAFAFLPPITSLLAGLTLVSGWWRYGAARWLKLPEHLRRGLARLYLAITVPWGLLRLPDFDPRPPLEISLPSFWVHVGRADRRAYRISCNRLGRRRLSKIRDQGRRSPINP
jgi:hypothetical protein